MGFNLFNSIFTLLRKMALFITSFWELRSSCRGAIGVIAQSLYGFIMWASMVSTCKLSYCFAIVGYLVHITHSFLHVGGKHFWAAAPNCRCPVEQRVISRCPSVLPSILSSPPWPSKPQNCPPSPHFCPKFCPPGLKSAPPPASNLTSRPAICPSDLQLALQAKNKPSKHQISSPWLKFALQTLNLLSKPYFFPPAFKYAFSGPK